VCHSLDLILPVSMWNGCVGDLVHMCCVPQNFKRTDTSLDQLNSMMQMAKDFAKSESKTNTNLYSYFFCLFNLFCRLQVMKT
jgi:hypothetical protein